MSLVSELKRRNVIRVAIGYAVVDIAYGGDYYTIVDADAIELSLKPSNDAAIIAASVVIREAVAEQLEITHPEQPHINQCYQVQFTSASKTVGDYKRTIVSPPGAIDRRVEPAQVLG